MTRNNPPKRPLSEGAEIPKMQTIKTSSIQDRPRREVQNGAEVPTMRPVQTAPEKGQGGKPDKK